MTHEDADVLVLGGGLAGFCAAVEATDVGLSVAILEKAAAVGGSSVESSGFIAFADTPVQRSLGIKDSPATLREDLLGIGESRNDVALVDAYVAEQRGTFEWLQQRDVRFLPQVEIASGQSVPRAHVIDPAQLLTALATQASQRGVRVETRTRALRLGLDDAGRTASVETSTPGGPRRFTAGRGIVLASGGFSRERRLIELFAPSQEKALLLGADGNVGDGLLMGWSLGGAIRDVAFIRGTFGKHPTASRVHSCLSIYKGAIAVNALGHRFVDESLPYKLVGDACLAQPGGIAYQIFDQGIYDTKTTAAVYDFDAMLKAACLLSAPTLAELAGLCGIPGQTLENTVLRYDRGVSAGSDDDFGRAGLVRGTGRRRSIEDPPFYAHPSTSAIYATHCGLHTTAAAQVIDVYGEVIPGLFAAGEVTGGLHGAGYMTGSALGKAAIFGRIAGRSVAAT